VRSEHFGRGAGGLRRWRAEGARIPVWHGCRSALKFNAADFAEIDRQVIVIYDFFVSVLGAPARKYRLIEKVFIREFSH
jgi:hypothetical protein